MLTAPGMALILTLGIRGFGGDAGDRSVGDGDSGGCGGD